MKKTQTNKTKAALWTLVTLGAVAVFFLLIYFVAPWVYSKQQEAKYSELIQIVESATTPAEEKEAFILAAKSGVVWSTGYVHDDHLPERVRHLKGKKVYHVEWFELGLSKESTTAYRVILDESNLQYLKSTGPTDDKDNKKREQNSPADAGQ